MTAKPPSDLSTLATEALDLWQEYLATLAADPKAKADLAQILEPQRQLFAEWIKKAQNAGHGTAPFPATQANATEKTAAGTATLRPADDDRSLRFAKLALRVAELEKRVARLESGKPCPAGKTSKPSERP